MDRRGFLGSLAAITAAVASGLKLPKGAEVAAALPKAVAVQNQLLDLIKDCHALSIESHCYINGPMTFTVEYIHSPDSKKSGDTLMVETYTKNMRPISVQLSHKVGDLPRVTVEWA
jgi:hypothetical protein